MRKMLPLAAVLILSMTATAPAQFTDNGATISNGLNTNAAASAVPTVGLGQMIPKLNGAQMLGSPLNAQKSFNFAKMIPNFSWMRSKLWPIATPTSQYPSNLFGQSQQAKPR
jgi:hypothetical protein